MARAGRPRGGRRPAARPRQPPGRPGARAVRPGRWRVRRGRPAARGARSTTTLRRARARRRRCARTCGWARVAPLPGPRLRVSGASGGFETSTASTRRSTSSRPACAPATRGYGRADASAGWSRTRAGTAAVHERTPAPTRTSTPACATRWTAARRRRSTRATALAGLRVLEAARRSARHRSVIDLIDWSDELEDEPWHLGAGPDGHPLRARRLPARARARRRPREGARAPSRGSATSWTTTSSTTRRSCREENLDEVRDALDGHGIYTICTGTHLDPRFGKGGLSSPDDASAPRRSTRRCDAADFAGPARRPDDRLARGRGLQLPVPDPVRGRWRASSTASARSPSAAPSTASSSSSSTRTPSPR